MSQAVAMVDRRRLAGLRGQLAVVSATVFFSSLAFDLFNGTLPIYLYNFRGYSLNLIGALVGLASLTQLAGALVAGPFIDSRGARLTLRLGPTLYLPAALIFATAHDPLLLGLARVLQATGFVLVLPAAYSLLPGMVSVRRRATGLAIVGVANTSALALGSPLGLWLLGRAPGALFGTSALSALLALAAGSLLVVGAPPERRVSGFRLRGAWLPFLLGSFLAFVNWGLLLAFLPLQVPITRAVDVGWFFAADAIALTILRLPAGYANDRYGGRAMAAAGIACSLAALLVLLQSRSLAALVLAGAGTGGAAALLLPAIQLELSLRSREGERGTAMSLASASFALAVSVGTLAGEPLIARVGFDRAIWLAALVCAAGAVPILLARPVRPLEEAAPAAARPALSPLEARVAEVWSEVLGLDDVRAGDAFLDLGGQSLHAIQIASRLSEAFDAEIPLVHVFEHATVAESAAAIEALLAVPGHHAAPHVRRAPPGNEAPASFAQERIWFLEQLDPGLAAYNVPFALRLRGPLDEGALARALELVVERQEALRTRFETSGGEVLQVVDAPRYRPLGMLDLSARGPEGAETAAAALIAAESRLPFDLAAGPLYRSKLLRLAPEDHFLVLTLHHSVCDEWSRRVLLRELASGYRAGGEAASSNGTPPPVRYRDFAAWQRQSMLGGRHRDLLQYWTGELAGASRALNLPLDRPRPAERTYRGGTVSVPLPAELVKAVQALSRSHDVTPFMAMLAAFGVLLQRHTGQDDILIGSPVANRSLAQTDELVGCFVNTLVLRLRMAGDPAFTDLLSRVRRTCLDAYANSELPFEKLVEVLHPDRDMSRTPLFQVMFDMESTPPRAEFPEGLEAEQASVETGTSLFDLSLTLAERTDGVTAVIEYSIDLFDRDSAERMAARLVTLLHSVVDAPDLPLSRLEFIPESERADLVRFAAGPSRPASAAVYRQFELHARMQPERAAVEQAGRQVTYGELNARANQLARLMVARGAGPGHIVAVCLDRSVEFVTAVLAAHKAASAYVPLDPAYPAARLTELLADTTPAVLVTETRFAGRFDSAGVELISLDAVSGELDRLPWTDLAFEPGPSDLAYVIHTSGSTGRPKGVMVTQSALANWADAAARTYGLSAADRVLQFHSVGFDASAGDIFSTLAAGGTLVVAPQSVRYSAAALLDELPTLRTTVADLPTAYWHELVDELEGRRTAPVGLRLVIIGGEVALPEKVRRWQRFVDPRIRLANSYGPTESTVVATVWWLHPGFADEAAAAVPIGRPVSNVHAYVLDTRRQPCPIGVAGELHLGGAQLAAGYLNLREETERRFASTDPLGAGRRERLYRTGDLVRWLPDGNLEFLGRVDRQLKIRGVRIEPEEVEAAIGLHERVAEVAVEARERVPGDLRLVAYVVGRPGRVPAAGELREHLEQRLPPHEVPSVFVMLDRLPLTSSGKVDRSALPAPLPGSLADGGVPALLSPLEARLAGIWMDVLGMVGSLGADDNFFELGGHSLLAARLVGRVRSELAVELPIRAVFEAPTLAALAGRIEVARTAVAAERQALEQSRATPG